MDEFLRILTEGVQRRFPQSASLRFCSYDDQSLFTNIPFNDTIEKIVEEVFKVSNIYEFEGVVFSKDTLKEALELCAKDQLFLFSNEIWKQGMEIQWDRL